jgi:hypothetical protein
MSGGLIREKKDGEKGSEGEGEKRWVVKRELRRR